MASSEPAAAPARHRVAVLAPLPLELDAVIAAFGLESVDEDESWIGGVGDSTVTAVRCGMGPDAAHAVATEVLDRAASAGSPIEHVMVVGICGGLDPEVDVGTVLFPEHVVDRASGNTFRHAAFAGDHRIGTLVTVAEVSVDPDVSRQMHADGIIGVDMESSAVAAICQERGLSWSVHRCISDRWVDGLLDPRVAAMTASDGSVDLDALTQLLSDEPELADRLGQLGNDAVLAAQLAAEDALRTCRALDGRAPV